MQSRGLRSNGLISESCKHLDKGSKCASLAAVVTERAWLLVRFSCPQIYRGLAWLGKEFCRVSLLFESSHIDNNCRSRCVISLACECGGNVCGERERRRGEEGLVATRPHGIVVRFDDVILGSASLDSSLADIRPDLDTMG